MYILRVENNQIKLPNEVAAKLSEKYVQIIEIKNGFMLIPLAAPIKEARGILKNKRFSTEIYFKNKLEDKELE